MNVIEDALFLAVSTGDIAAVRRLISSGASARSPTGHWVWYLLERPLHPPSGWAECVALLLEAGGGDPHGGFAPPLDAAGALDLGALLAAHPLIEGDVAAWRRRARQLGPTPTVFAGLVGRGDVTDDDLECLLGVKVVLLVALPRVTPAGFAHLRQAHTLVVESCPGASDAALAHCPALHTLIARDVPLTDAAFLAALGGLHTLDLDACAGVTDGALAALGGLHTLSLRACPGISGAGFAHLAAIEQISIDDAVVYAAGRREGLHTQRLLQMAAAGEAGEAGGAAALDGSGAPSSISGSAAGDSAQKPPHSVIDVQSSTELSGGSSPAAVGSPGGVADAGAREGSSSSSSPTGGGFFSSLVKGVGGLFSSDTSPAQKEEARQQQLQQQQQQLLQQQQQQETQQHQHQLLLLQQQQQQRQHILHQQQLAQSLSQHTQDHLLTVASAAAVLNTPAHASTATSLSHAVMLSNSALSILSQRFASLSGGQDPLLACEEPQEIAVLKEELVSSRAVLTRLAESVDELAGRVQSAEKRDLDRRARHHFVPRPLIVLSKPPAAAKGAQDSGWSTSSSIAGGGGGIGGGGSRSHSHSHGSTSLDSPRSPSLASSSSRASSSLGSLRSAGPPLAPLSAQQQQQQQGQGQAAAAQSAALGGAVERELIEARAKVHRLWMEKLGANYV